VTKGALCRRWLSKPSKLSKLRIRAAPNRGLRRAKPKAKGACEDKLEVGERRP